MSASRAKRLDAILALKAARSGGSRAPPALEHDDVDIYDEVSEQTYQSIVRGRMMEDDFIEDDDGSGYVDHGQDEWERGASESDDTENEEDYFERTGRRKPKKGAKRAKRAAAGQSDYAGRARRRDVQDTPSFEARPAANSETEAEFMARLMGGLSAPMTTPSRPQVRRIVTESEVESPLAALARKRKHVTQLPPLSRGDMPSSSTEASSDPPEVPEAWNNVHISGNDSPPWESRDVSVQKRQKHEDDVDEDFGIKSVERKRAAAVTVAVRPDVKTIVPTPQKPPLGDTPVPKLRSWHTVQSTLAEAPSSPADATPRSTPGNAAATGVQCMQDDRSVHFFWTDYYEIQGTVHLFGKVLDKNTGKYVSASVSVGGIERCIFLQPRERVLQDGHPTDVVPGEEQLYDEFESMRSKFGIQAWLGKWVTRKYAFELPDVPSEGEYLKVKYGFDEPQLPMDVSGSTFVRAFGTNTTAFELFVIKRRIMGPCWLRVSHATQNTGAAQTWTKVEFSVDDPKDVSPFSDSDENAPKEVPPLTVMSLSLRSVVNYKENKREVVALSTRVWRDLALENTAPPEQLPSVKFTAVRPLGNAFPSGFEAEARKSRIQALKYERMVLNSFLAQVQMNDPDVILAHDFAGTGLDILLHRMRDLKCDQWSKLGRWRRTKWPNLRQGMNTRLLAGRLVCDLSSDTAKGMISSTTWSLSEMCRTHLDVQREDIDPDDVPSFFDCTAPTPERLLNFVGHCEVDSFFQMAIASRVQILALTKQLTNLAGNAWTRTLTGGRAERNEYILLHEFHRKKYICPDKISAWDKKAMRRAGEEAPQKKEKFRGGLVFEPKRGLWDKYILVMDFNSLYPSIIQEFNIDFTTVARAGEGGGGDDEIPEIPSSDVAQGVLPHLIATLVNRRRQVKSLMKDKSAPEGRLLQWNIKQQALKLTANSMYGCLGFENSRFYARPLAALTTFKGREILSTTRELAESMSLDVIYGDTDSVMINTNCVDYKEALRIGHEFRRAVNDKYRLLEIDIDGVFQRMLLLQKKKYAALLVSDGNVQTEIKGLDMKRREYCALSKQVSAYVLECILSGEATEVVVESIHEYLGKIATDVQEGRIPLEDYVIYKRLGKRPQDYPDAHNQPHVQVALRMLAKNENARSGDVIPYVFCVGTGQEKTQAERAFHPDDVRRHSEEETHKVDYQFYLAHQILPPIERLCDSIDGTDRVRLAQCLGLDVQTYAAHASNSSERAFAPLESQVPSTVRYAKCEALLFKCRSCGESSTFDGLAALRDVQRATLTLAHGFCCQNERCGAPMSLPSMVVQLELAMRMHISQYYDGWTECTEPSCGAKTRMTGVYSGRCLVSGCRGKVAPQYSDKQLYTQLCYYDYLFDSQQALTEAGDAPHRAYIQDTFARHKETITTLHNSIQRYLGRSGRRYVGLGRLFSFMKV
ncbi:DNA-directed DNA polymerase [Malassezia cuniculi]|uniref:DNA polymerase n=1 Tax=Malassezia cuniculi TaxID=948313 RepID=A0AAF0ENR2_9BASI|nr:DNA-directed DNA polymerase [Malassezia cuniculi]